MIYKNSRVTTYIDSAENLVEAARETFYSARETESVVAVWSERTGNKIVVDRSISEAETSNREIAEAALEAGWWLEPKTFGDGWCILFDWTRDESKPPKNGAIHRTRGTL